MGWSIAHAGMLAGLALTLIPIALHFWRGKSRPRVEWGAMRFLPSASGGDGARSVDEWLLLAARVGALCALVLALAGLAGPASSLAWFGEASSSRTIFVLDRSFSMSATVDGKSRWDLGLEAIEDLGPPGRDGVVLAGQPPRWLKPDDGETARSALDREKPHANPDLPGAVRLAWDRLKERNQLVGGEIVLITDGQFLGLADEDMLAGWRRLGVRMQHDLKAMGVNDAIRPTLRFHYVGAESPTPANSAVGPLVASRTVIPPGQAVTFHVDLPELPGDRRRTVRYIVDGRVRGVLASSEPAGVNVRRFRFSERLDSVGRHVVSVRADHEPAEAVVLDDERHVIVDVVPQTTLFVIAAPDREAAANVFLEKALDDRPEDPWKTGVRVVRLSQEKLAAGALARETNSTGRKVVLLADVASLEREAESALERFLEAGGGVLVALGPKTDAEAANRNWRRQGLGWLPVEVVRANAPTDPFARPTPDVTAIRLPGFVERRDLFQPSLGQARFSRWWSTRVDADATVLARLSNGEPWLIERRCKLGKVLVCSTPLDDAWDSPLVKLWEYPLLVSSLVERLATPTTSYDKGGPPTDVGLHHISQDRVHVVEPNAGESTLRRIADHEGEKLVQALPIPVTAIGLTDAMVHSPAGRRDLSSLGWLAVAVFLLAETGLLGRRRSSGESRP